MLISNSRVRYLLTQFVSKGILQSEANELQKVVEKHAQFLIDLIHHLLSKSSEVSRVKCPSEWKSFVQALASRSAVCSLIHPSNELMDLLVSFTTDETNLFCLSVNTLHYIQKKVPVLFDLLNTLKSLSYECHSLRRILSPIIVEVVKKANAPFINTPTEEEVQFENESPVEEEDISFFPHLTHTRQRGVYAADRIPGNKICTKNRVGHPTLLPGVFTLFCEHGKNM